MLWPSVSIAAKMESSPRTGISRLISQEPLEKAPVHMTIHQSAHERAPRRNRSRRKVTASGRFLEKGNSDIKSVSTSAPMYQGYGWRLIVDFAVSAKIDAMISEKINNIDIWLPPCMRCYMVKRSKISCNRVCIGFKIFWHLYHKCSVT